MDDLPNQKKKRYGVVSFVKKTFFNQVSPKEPTKLI